MTEEEKDLDTISDEDKNLSEEKLREKYFPNSPKMDEED